MRTLLRFALPLLLLPTTFLPAQLVRQPVVSTVAGNGSTSYTFAQEGGSPLAFGLSDPYGTAFDRVGNLYIADSSHNRIEKISAATGTISTYAGTGAATSTGDGGQARSATLSGPTGLAVDAVGNLYVSEQYFIRRIDAAGIITTIAGNGSTTYSASQDGGQATASSLLVPGEIALDPTGSILYIADQGHFRVRKVVLSTGVITTIAGTDRTLAANTGSSYPVEGSQATTAYVSTVFGLATDSAGDVYFGSSRGRLHKVTVATGALTTVAGSASSIGWPMAITFDRSGNLYFATGNTIYLMTNAGGTPVLLAGNPSNTTYGYVPTDDTRAATSASVQPGGLAVDPAGNLYWGDTAGNRVRTIPFGDNTLRFPTLFTGTVTSPTLLLRTQTALTVSDVSVTQGLYSGLQVTGCQGTVAAGGTCTATVSLRADQPGSRSGVITFTTDLGTFNFGFQGLTLGGQIALTPGVVTTLAGTGVDGDSGDGGFGTDAQVNLPTEIVADTAGNFYLPEFSGRVRKLNSSGFISTVAGSGNSPYVAGDEGALATRAHLLGVFDVAARPNGGFYLADTNNNRVRLVDANGIITTYAGNGTQGTTADGVQATATSIGLPKSLALDSTGSLYIADQSHCSVRKVDRSGYISTVAGKNTCLSTAVPHVDGQQATATNIAAPQSVRLDAGNNIYFVEGPYVRKIDATTGVLTTVAGNGTSTYAAADEGASATSVGISPRAIALDAAGNLYITDYANGLIRRVTLADGKIRKLAGTGASGSTLADDGKVATSVILTHPTGIAIDLYGDIVYTDVSPAKGGGNSSLVRLIDTHNSALAFASTTINSTSSDSPQTVRVASIGNAPYALTLPSMGSNPSVSDGFVYGSNSTCPQVFSTSGAVTLRNGAECTAMVSFNPTMAGTYTGSLVYPATDEPHTVALTGTGADPAATALALTGLTNGTAGARTVTVTATSSGGAAASGYTGTVHFTSTDTAAVLPADYTFTSADTGVHVFPVTLKMAGLQSVTVTDVVATTLTTSASATITAATPAAVTSFAGNGQDAVIGAAFARTLQAQVKDAYGNPVSGTTVAFSAPASGASASLAADTATTDANGVASTSATANGTASTTPYSVTAAVQGLPAASFQLTNDQATTTVTLSSTSAGATVPFGQAVPITPTLSPALAGGSKPTGNYQITINGVVSGGINPPLQAGGYSFNESPGPNSVTFRYLGDTNFAASAASSAVSWTVVKATPTVSGAAVSLTYGTSTTTVVTVAGTSTSTNVAKPSGSVTYTIGSGAPQTATLTAGVATLTIPAATSISNTSIVVNYGGDNNYNTATTTLSLAVSKGTPDLSFPTGTALVYGAGLGSAQLDATSSVAGTITYSRTLGEELTPGTYTVHATFTPTDTVNYNSASADGTVIVNPAPLTVTATNATRAYGVANSAFTTTLSSTVNGDVLAGSATTTATATSAAGTYAIVPSVSGANLAYYAVTAVNGTLTVTKAATTTVLTTTAASVTAGSAFTLTATVAPATATGTVQFLSGNTSLGSGTVTNGVAMLSVNSLAVGSYTVTAVYAGDGNYATSTSSVITQTITGVPDFTITVAPSSLTIKQGASGTAVFTVTPINGYTGTINFACGGLPTGAACAFAPPSLTLTGQVAVTSTLTITTTAPVFAMQRAPMSPFGPWQGGGAALAALAGCVAGWRKRRLMAGVRIFIALAAVAFLPLVGCGGSSSGGSSSTTTPTNSGSLTPTGTTSLSIAASTSAGTGSVNHTAALSVTITQ